MKKFNEQHYVLLTDLSNSGLLSERSGSVMEMVRRPEILPADSKMGELGQGILGSADFADLELLHQAKDYGTIWYLFYDETVQQGVITVTEPETSGIDDSYSISLDEAIHNLKEVMNPETEYVFTGSGHGGWKAALLAELLGCEAIIFNAPTVEDLPGRVINYIGEDEPVGEHLEKVIFVKQVQPSDDIDESLLLGKLAFDTNGKAVVTAQSDFSKFVSWFYNTAGSIEPDIWNIFFPNCNEEESTILADLGVYSVYLKVGELSDEKILHAIRNTVRYASEHLETNRIQLDANLDKLVGDDYESRIAETAEKHAMRSTEFVVRIFESVQTILMGIALFSMEEDRFDMNITIDSLHVQIHELLDLDLRQVRECLDQAIARRLETLFEIPQFQFDW